MSKNKKIIFLVTDPITPVVDSQVLALSERLSESNVNVSVVFLLQTQHYKDYLADKEKWREIKTIDSIFFCPYQFNIVGRFFSFVYLLKIILFNWKHSIVFHCRGLQASQFANDIKQFSILKKYVISDVRGDNVAEAKGEKFIISRVLKAETNLAVHSDACFFVSKHLKKVIEMRSGKIQGKSKIFYCTADESRYAFNATERQRIRHLYGLDESPVIIYSGSVGRWHCFEKVLELSSMLAALNENINFLFLVNNPRDAKDELEKYIKLDNRVTVLNVLPSEVASYLSAGDIAILLREQNPTNESASPVKFAEYVLSGIKVVISAAIHDYSLLTKEHSLGWVVDNLSKDELNDISISINDYLGTFPKRKKLSANIKSLSKHYHVESLCKFYSDL